MLTVVSESRCFGGTQSVCSHASRATGSAMRFAVYVPPHHGTAALPVVYWLSGLTCTEENFIVKAGAQRVAAALGVALVVPDTSPRIELPGDRESYDFGVGAGFWLDATEPPWASHYRMETYVVDELPEVVADAFPIDTRRAAVMRHSMGGHGALSLALRHPERFRSVSAFAPIASTLRSPWGQKALRGYLGADERAWREHDVTVLLRERGWRGPPILVDQGMADPFLAEQLRPDLLREAARDAAVPLVLNEREGYDHSYYFIASFIEGHLRHHAAVLGVPA